MERSRATWGDSEKRWWFALESERPAEDVLYAVEGAMETHDEHAGEGLSRALDPMNHALGLREFFVATQPGM